MINPNLPLIDLHRHLDGSIRLATIIELGRKHNLPLPAFDVDSLRPHVQVTAPQPGVMEFISKFKWMTGVLVDYEACYRVAMENVEDAHNEGIDYIELRFSPQFMAFPHHLNPQGVVEAVVAGASAGRESTGQKVNLIGILSRTYGEDCAWRELETLLKFRDHLVAIDLAGDEVSFPGHLFVRHMQRVRETGLFITVHAGEAAGANSIWQALHQLGANRIGHAVHAVDDADLMVYLVDHRIGIEVNLTSNVQTSTVSNYASHPLRSFLEHGLLATINSDDPGISGINLAHEYRVAAPAVGLSVEQIHQAQRNALEVAFLSQEEKVYLLREVANRSELIQDVLKPLVKM